MILRNAQFVRSAADPSGFPGDGRPRVVFAGRSNVGKSSTINSLVGRKGFARVSASPGKTIFVNLFLAENRLWLVDLPGYGKMLAEQTVFHALLSHAGKYFLYNLVTARVLFSRKGDNWHTFGQIQYTAHNRQLSRNL